MVGPSDVLDELRLADERNPPAAEALRGRRVEDLPKPRQSLLRLVAARPGLPAVEPLVIARCVDDGMTQSIELVARTLIHRVVARPPEDVADADHRGQVMRVEISQHEPKPDFLGQEIRCISHDGDGKAARRIRRRRIDPTIEKGEKHEDAQHENASNSDPPHALDCAKLHPPVRRLTGHFEGGSQDMRHLLLAALLCTAAITPGAAQNAAPGRELESTLTFETTHTGAMPSGWTGGPPSTIFVDGETVHSGRWAARIERTDGAGGQPFSALTRSIPMDFAGNTIEWRGFLRSENVSEFMALWMRQDGDAPNLAFATMQPQQIKGTNEWREYSITFPLHPDGRQLYFGVLLGGTGRVWADDLRLLIDGKPVWEAPKVERPKTPLELDHQFD